MITKLKKQLGDKSNGKYICKPSLHFISLGTMNVVDTISALAEFTCVHIQETAVYSYVEAVSISQFALSPQLYVVDRYGQAQYWA